ncbi:hypothetical protein Bca52824_030911 [Brassica carinata]|uniref:Uncharacterized protein n=1 Tax=Brassica carinata TaxID=52824 RepID=A0A8X7SBC5_BRACI|nr:hypothetical protein Bca52824_030911 [Brassica carinata]
MARRFSAEDKGKSIAGNPMAPPRIRVRAPEFDPSELIKENTLTLVGRLTNSREQKMSSVLPYLAKKWNLEGSSGSDLGRDCFQFRFKSEKEICEVLQNRPYQYGRWMIIVQRWEPIISPNFPAHIPFWISIRGLPLHYWHEKVVRNLGLELGELEHYEVTKSSARIRVIVDGLKPLVMEMAMDFKSGEESILTLDYEGLGNHCSICYRLSHLQSHCPERPAAVAIPPLEIPPTYSQHKNDLPVKSEKKFHRYSKEATTHADRPYQQRVDRHGKPFGDRISSFVPRPSGPRNKIAPAASNLHISPTRDNVQYAKNQGEQSYHSPPYTRRRLNRVEDRREHESPSTTHRQSPTLQWRAKSPVAVQEATPPTAPTLSARNTLGRNLNETDFPPLPGVPTTEEVMEDLRIATLQYVSCADPVESAARKQRVLQSELNGMVEETAANIIHSATLASLAATGALTSQAQPPEAVGESSSHVQPYVTQTEEVGLTERNAKKRGRPARSSSARTSIRLSPKTFSGTGSRKRNLVRTQASSPGTSNKAATRQTKKVSTSTDFRNSSDVGRRTCSLALWTNVDITEFQRNENQALYKAIWSSKVSPKLHLFLWKLVQGALPLGENLAKRGMLNNIVCRHCEELETAEHLFLHCSYTRRIWDSSIWKQDFNPSSHDTFTAAFLTSSKQINLPPLGVTETLFPWICWGIWTARNFFIFENRKFLPGEILVKAIKSAQEWTQAQPQTRTLAAAPRTTIRPLSHPSLVTCFTDAAWNATTNQAGCGWYFIDNETNSMLQGTKAMDYVSSPLMAEAMAIRSALLHALEAGFSKICIKSDCQALVATITSKRHSADLYVISRDIEHLSSCFLSISFSFISRNLNSLADSIAKSVLYSALN